ncbi:MAG TPA: ATP-binding protein, partial [Telluria sp.]|nr:ATP-binding protein [Telluria sp.]
GLRKLTVYAAQVEAGQKAALPQLGDDEIGALGRALDSMRHQLEGKQYAEELMHTLAHELKSPIAAIQASAELLREEMPEAERRRFLINIEEQNARQRQLIDRLLALVRVEQQQRLAVREPVALPDLLALAAADARPKADARAVALEIDAGDHLAVPGDPLLLRQALGNLVDNALDFAPRGGRVRVRARRDDDAVRIEVCDDGPGVPDYALARVFERFYSLPRPDGAKSTGLGLAFVREVALLHGGAASLANGPDGGACARLRLPLH